MKYDSINNTNRTHKTNRTTQNIQVANADSTQTYYLQYREGETNYRIYKNADDGTNEENFFVAEYRPRFWYPSEFIYDPKRDVMTTTLGARLNLIGKFIYRRHEPNLSIEAPHHYISILISTKRIDGLTYRIIKQEKRSKADYILETKYYLYETDGGYNFHIGDQVEITKGGFLHKVSEKQDIFDEPILESAELHKVNIKYISWSSGQLHSYSNNEATCKNEFYHIKLTDESGDWYTVSFQTKEDLDRVYKEMTAKDTIFLVAEDFGLFYVNAKMPNTAIENKLQYIHTGH